MSRIREHQLPIHSLLEEDLVLRPLVVEFVGEVPNRIARLRRQLESRDWQGLQRSAHQLKGAFGSYGFDQLTTLAAQLEGVLARQSDLQVITTAFDELAAACRRVAVRDA